MRVVYKWPQKTFSPSLKGITQNSCFQFSGVLMQRGATTDYFLPSWLIMTQPWSRGCEAAPLYLSWARPGPGLGSHEPGAGAGAGGWCSTRALSDEYSGDSHDTRNVPCKAYAKESIDHSWSFLGSGTVINTNQELLLLEVWLGFNHLVFT